MPFELHHLSAQEQWDWIQRRDATVLELVEHALGRIERLDGDLGAFARVDAERARETAAPIAANANTGPDRPTNGSTSKGASAGPTIVPSPNDEASVDSAPVRSARVVRLAT